MTRPFLAILCVAVLAGCGGGSGTEAPEPEPVIALSTDQVSGLSPTYVAVFDCSGNVSVNGIPASVTGTYTLETSPLTVDSLINGLTGRLVVNTIVLTAAGQTFDLEIREFIYVDGSGRWWSLGGEDTQGNRTWWSGTPPAYYPPPVDETVEGRILNLDSTMSVGQVIDVPEIDALEDPGLTTVLFTRASTRNTVATEVVDTALGRYECYRTNSSETITYDGNDPVTVSYIRWERPEMGLIALHAEGIEVTADVGGSTYTVNVQRLDCTLRSYTP